ncbi:class I SAM-dependent methyltransferase [Mycobacterium sp. 663a-19]|uniref:class I SAM-dependent methyltransferase n=1 Tax=Mycobacterium sp. 663a-19 TaxID=2986148 RepID=UPI002D1F4D8A|nr:class I SAM-dependent methyltransferase [Mycobacterium sp. 663a-19]MEB3980324.1 class I SAM-dependent methyltransferase [Mycobacterium sp. 663a-19]
MQKNRSVGGANVRPTWVRRGTRLVGRSLEIASRFEPIRRALFEYYDQRSKRFMRLAPAHPFDNEYAIKTSGVLPGSVLRLGYPLKATTGRVGYLGVQPSILRRALNILPVDSGTTFVDLGCGKGRALVVASEFPFGSIVGVEISPELAEVASENALVVRRNHPQRTPISVVEGDVLDYALPPGNLVIFLFNPFEKVLITQLLNKIEAALQERDSSIYVVYINPVCGHIFDGSSMLSRIYAESLPYDPAEIGTGPDSSDTVIIWQDRKNPRVSAREGVDRRIVVTTFGMRAELVD